MLLLEKESRLCVLFQARLTVAPLIGTFHSKRQILSFKSHNLRFNYLNAAVSMAFSVTRLGDLLDFVQLFEAFGNN